MAKLCIAVWLATVVMFGWVTLTGGVRSSGFSAPDASGEANSSSIEVRGSRESGATLMRQLRWIGAASLVCAGIAITAVQLGRHGRPAGTTARTVERPEASDGVRGLGRVQIESSVFDEVAAD